MKLHQALLAATASVAMIGTFAQAKGFREPPAEVKAAFQACAAQIGVTLTEGERPNLTNDQREEMHACLDAKGIKPPREGRGGRGHHRNFAKMKQCLAAAGVTLPGRVPGQRLQPDDATRAAMRACHEKFRQERKGEQPVNTEAQ